MICRPAILNSGAHPAPASVRESCAAASPAIALIVSKNVVNRILQAMLSRVCATLHGQILVNTSASASTENFKEAKKDGWHGGPSLAPSAMNWLYLHSAIRKRST